MDNELQILLKRYCENGLTPDERLRLGMLMRDPANQLYLAAMLDEQLNEEAQTETSDTATGRKILGELMKQIMPHADIQSHTLTRPRSHFGRWWAAAALLVVLAGGIYIWLAEKKGVAPALAKSENISIPPGREGAVLTLADGSQVELNNLEDGPIAFQNGANPLIKNGRLMYDDREEGAATIIAYNKVTTPKGRQFQVVLPDGTKVWLNAASSLRFPLSFTENVRRVEVTGEAYFEVEKNSRFPFIVDIDKRSVLEVLGTSFNINSYADEENIRTSLLEGSVKITASDASVILKPGQQAQIANTAIRPENTAANGLTATKTPGGISVISHIDMDKVMAWKNGLFNFEDASLQEVMRQLERWYDITVVYESGIPDIEFVGKMSKNISLDDLLEILRKTKVHFRLEEGRKLVVMR